MKKYRVRWTHATRRMSAIQEFDDFYEAMNYITKTITDNDKVRNATIYDIENDRCICAFRDIR
jgi:hypothetical protein